MLDSSLYLLFIGLSTVLLMTVRQAITFTEAWARLLPIADNW